MPSVPEPLPQIPGYEVVRPIGLGGMGRVYEAVRLGAGGFRKAVALKVLGRRGGLSPDALERFLREARIAARLEHPGIVRVYELLSDAQRDCLVMELLRGRNLYELREAVRGPMPAWVVFAAAAQVLDALAYAHALAGEDGRPLGLVHRDLTPGNVFLCGDGTAKILDFGLAKLRGGAGQALTHAGMVAGTIAFMSPEQARGEEVDARSDLYQVGATMYHLLTGAWPHGDGPQERDRIDKALLPPHRSLEELRPGLPPAAVEVVKRAMSLEAANRFPSAAAMRDAIRAALPGLGSGADAGPEALGEWVASLAQAPTASGPGDPTWVNPATGPAKPEPVTRPPLTGAVIAGRYHIVRFVAQGGMGEVYEAEDQALGGRVALKTIRSEIARDATVIERFKRELQLARKVTHPNVCRMFEFGRHAHGGEEMVFLTMELLSGETLAARLARTGPMGVAQAMPIVSEVAAGLAAAHAAGVVHRDFKSENVILVPRGPGEPERAVVTDFGVARAAASATGGLTGTAGFVGSPSYMAPEQVSGKPTTPATDLYALGVVMYEMVTGRLPFQGDTPIATALMRLSSPPTPPSTHLPSIDRRWEETILHCLAREPKERPQSALEVVLSLGGEVVSGPWTSSGPLSRVRRRGAGRSRRALWAAGLVALAVAGGFAAWRLAPPPGPPAPVVRRSVVVLGLKNLTGRAESAWLGPALSETLSAELSASGTLRTVPGENVARMLAEVAVPDPSSLGPETLHRVRSNLGTDLVVGGAYLATSGKLRVDLQLHDAQSGESLGTVSASGDEAALLDVVARAGASLREALGTARLTRQQAAELQASLPTTSEAARLHAEGLARLRRSDAEGARGLLEKAVAAAPEWPLAHSALAQAWSTLGYDAKAKEEAKRAFELSEKLSREERLSVEALYRGIANDWARAAELYGALFRFYPADLEYGLKLANAQLHASKLDDAFATLEALRKLPAPASDDPRIDFTEAQVAQTKSDFRRDQAAAARAATKAAANGAPVLVAHARLVEGWALRHLGEPKKALEAYADAKRLCDAAAARECSAGAVTYTAEALWRSGDLAGARASYEAALKVHEEMGDRRAIGNTYNNLAIVLRESGKTAEARKMYEASLAIRYEVGNKSGAATTIGNLANLLSAAGETEAAYKRYEESLALYRELGDRNGVATTLGNLGTAHYEGGDLKRAREELLETVKLFRELNDKSPLATNLVNLGGILYDEGDTAGARKLYEEAQAMFAELGEKSSIAFVRLARADLEIDEGHAGDAEAFARDAADEFASQKVVAFESMARAEQARAMFAQGGRTQEALAVFERARSAAEKIEEREPRVFVPIVGAKLRATAGDPAGAQEDVEGALREAERTHLYRYGLEGRLALGELELGPLHKPAEGRARLSALEKDASAHGFSRIARKAAAVAAGTN